MQVLATTWNGRKDTAPEVRLTEEHVFLHGQMVCQAIFPRATLKWISATEASLNRAAADSSTPES